MAKRYGESPKFGTHTVYGVNGHDVLLNEDGSAYNDLDHREPYSLAEYIESSGWLGGFFEWIWGEISGKNAARESNDTISATTISDYEHEEEMRELDYQNELRMFQDKSDLFASMGINPQAIAQGLTGSSGSGYSPSGSAGGTPPATANVGLLGSVVSSMIQAPYFQAAAKNQESQSRKNNIDADLAPVIVAQQIKESNAKVADITKRLEIDEKYNDSIIAVNNSIIGLNAEETENKKHQRDLMRKELDKLVAETEYTKTLSAHELIKMSKTKAETRNINADTELKEAQTELVNQQTYLTEAQTTGQDYENMLKSVEVTMSEIRVKVADAYGVDINSDECDMILEAGLTGHLAKINQAIQESQSGLFGAIGRGIDYSDELIRSLGEHGFNLFDFLSGK